VKAYANSIASAAVLVLHQCYTWSISP